MMAAQNRAETISPCGDSTRVVHPLFQTEDDGSSPISPLQLSIDECSVDTAMRLNEMFHSVLPVTEKGNLLRNKRSVFYAAHYENVYYATGIWTSPVAANRLKDGDRLLELRRLAISDDAPKNTASRMLKVMRILIKKRFPSVVRLVSYQAVDHHFGTIYRASGWREAGESDYAKWHPNQNRNEPQTRSKKRRWEFDL